MHRLLCSLLVLFAASIALVAQSAPASRTAGMKKQDGFIPLYYDDKKGDLFFELAPERMNAPLLHFASLATGVGSTNMFADRGSLGANNVIHFERHGNKVLVVAENTDFRAEQGTPELKKAVEAGFAPSVLAALPIESEESGGLLVKANALILRDAYGLLGQLRRPSRFVGGQAVRDSSSSGASWRLDADRSAVSMENTRAFPKNTEVEALLTFATDSPGGGYGQPDSGSLTVRQHQSFVAPPEPGFVPIERDPRVGYITNDFNDLSQPYTDLPPRAYITRWRLEKRDPKAAVSEPVKPITFFLDRAMPEPIRSAVRRGVLEWNSAFELAGFRNAVHVEDLPAGADPMDVRYSSILWTNRNGRGWSVGMIHTDPRTGEILHAIVQMDSHRMRTVGNYWESLTEPNPADTPRHNPNSIADPGLDLMAGLEMLAVGGSGPTEEQLVEERLALLGSHEFGHVIGLDHNFIASTFGRGSVMDYFSPRVRLNADGSLDLSDLYMKGIGSYDRFAIQWGYTPDKAARDKIVHDSVAKGILQGNYSDPRWNSYDDGPDPVTNLKAVLPVREAVLAKFGPQLLRAGEPNSTLQSRFALAYLYHRYAAQGAINVVGSAKIPPSLKGDGQIPVEVWPIAQQREAVKLLASMLAPEQLSVRPGLWRALAPTEDSSNDAERYSSSAGYLFSPEDGARSIAELVIQGLLDVQRLQRMKAIRLEDDKALTPGEVIGVLISAAFEVSKDPAAVEMQGVVRHVLGEQLMSLSVNENATSEVRADAWAGVIKLEQLLRPTDNASRLLLKEIELFKQDPYRNQPKRKAAQPPAGPPI